MFLSLLKCLLLFVYYFPDLVGLWLVEDYCDPLMLSCFLDVMFLNVLHCCLCLWIHSFLFQSLMTALSSVSKLVHFIGVLEVLCWKPGFPQRLSINYEWLATTMFPGVLWIWLSVAGANSWGRQCPLLGWGLFVCYSGCEYAGLFAGPLVSGAGSYNPHKPLWSMDWFHTGVGGGTWWGTSFSAMMLPSSQHVGVLKVNISSSRYFLDSSCALWYF